MTTEASIQTDEPPLDAGASIRRGPGRQAWMAALIVCLALLGLDIVTTYPGLPAPLDLRLKLPEGIANRVEPIVAAGTVNAGDFLMVTYQDRETMVFVYEAWGQPPVVSPRILFQPGRFYSLRLEMPGLAHAGETTASNTGTFVLTIDGQQLVRQEVPFNHYSGSRIFFGQNPVGGSTIGMEFRGEITTADGAVLRDHPTPLFPLTARLGTWLAKNAWHLLPLALLGYGLARLIQRRLDRETDLKGGVIALPRRGLARHGAFLGTATLSAIIFAWMMTGGKFRLSYPDAFGAFYDFQAQSLLNGRLDVPSGTLASEAFVVNGHEYGYFGPTPALLRLPFIAADVGFGHMTRTFLLLDFIACLFGVYFLLQYVTRRERGPDARPSAWAVILLTSATGIGSTLLFLSSRVYVYHEAILCGVAFAIWSSYFSLRYLDDARARHWIPALICGVLAVQSRPPAGLFALGLLGWAAVAHLVTHWRNRTAWREPIQVGLCATAGFATMFLMAYLKFGTIDGAPLKYHVQYTPERLAKIEGKNFHLSNLHHNLDAYVLRPAFQTGWRFPLFIFDLTKREYPGAKMDLEEKVVGILYGMTGLVFLAVMGAISAIRLPRFRRPLAVIGAAALPVVACMLTFIGTSHRYTADFCPPLVAAAVFGIGYLEQLTKALRVSLFLLASAATAFAFSLTLGLSFHFQVDLVWGVPEEIRSHFYRLRDATDRWIYPAK